MHLKNLVLPRVVGRGNDTVVEVLSATSSAWTGEYFVYQSALLVGAHQSAQRLLPDAVCNLGRIALSNEAKSAR